MHLTVKHKDGRTATIRLQNGQADPTEQDLNDIFASHPTRSLSDLAQPVSAPASTTAVQSPQTLKKFGTVFPRETFTEQAPTQEDVPGDFWEQFSKYAHRASQYPVVGLPGRFAESLQPAMQQVQSGVRQIAGEQLPDPTLSYAEQAQRALQGEFSQPSQEVKRGMVDVGLGVAHPALAAGMATTPSGLLADLLLSGASQVPGVGPMIENPVGALAEMFPQMQTELDAASPQDVRQVQDVGNLALQGALFGGLHAGARGAKPAPARPVEGALASSITGKGPKEKALYRGGAPSAMPRGKSALDVFNYETKELGNKISLSVPKDELAKIPSENLEWVTMSKKDAKEYGDVEQVEGGDFRVIAKDNQGGHLIERTPQQKAPSEPESLFSEAGANVWDEISMMKRQGRSMSEIKDAYKNVTDVTPDAMLRLEQGGGRPVVIYPNGQYEIGKPGETHPDFFRRIENDPNSPYQKYGNANAVQGRLGDVGQELAFWGDSKQISKQKMANVLFDMRRNKHIGDETTLHFAYEQGKTFSYGDFAKGKELLSTVIPGLTPENTQKMFDKIRELHTANGGSTYNPEKGSLSGKDLSSVSMFPDRELKIKGKEIPQGALEQFSQKNADLLKDPNNSIGTWYDTESGNSVLDIVKTLPHKEAMQAGREANQKAIYNLKTGETSDVIPAQEFERRRTEEPRIAQSNIAEKLGTEQPRTIDDLYRAAEKYTTEYLGHEPLGRKSEAKARGQRFVDEVLPVAQQRLQMLQQQAEARGEPRRQWYTDAPQEMRDVLSQHYPALKDNPAKQGLFDTVMSVWSNGKTPVDEFLAAVDSWKGYEATGKFSIPEEFKGVASLRGSIEIGINAVNRLLKDLGSEEAVVDWMKTKHPIKELKKYNKWTVAEEGRGRETYGAFIFGPKIGPYFLNKNGIHEFPTKDTWFDRTWRSAMGEMVENQRLDPMTGELFPVLRHGAKSGERRIMDDAMRHAAKELKLSVEDLQAIMWDFEREFASKNMNEFYGGLDFGQAAKHLDKTGWLGRRIRGEDADLTEARASTFKEAVRRSDAGDAGQVPAPARTGEKTKYDFPEEPPF
jgi:hypothetical protein